MSTRLPYIEFAFLLITALALYYKWPAFLILFAAVLVGFVRGMEWLGRHYPRTAIFLLSVIWSLLGSRGGRRW